MCRQSGRNTEPVVGSINTRPLRWQRALAGRSGFPFYQPVEKGGQAPRIAPQSRGILTRLGASPPFFNGLLAGASPLAIAVPVQLLLDGL